MESIEEKETKTSVINTDDMLGRILISALLGFIRFVFTVNIPFATIVMIASAVIFGYMLPEPTFWNTTPKPGPMAYVVIFSFWGFIGLIEPGVKTNMEFYKYKETTLMKIIAMVILIVVYSVLLNFTKFF